VAEQNDQLNLERQNTPDTLTAKEMAAVVVFVVIIVN